MGRQFVTAGQGLLKVFFGQALAVAAVVLSAAALLFQAAFFLYLSAIVNLAGFALVLVGLYGASIAHQGYRAAFGCVVVNVVVSLLGGLPALAAFGSILSILDLVVRLCSVYLVCKTTAALLTEKGDLPQAERTALMWKAYALCVAASAVCQMVAGGVHGSITSVVLSGVSLLLLAGAQIGYLCFLFGGQRYLQRI